MGDSEEKRKKKNRQTSLASLKRRWCMTARIMGEFYDNEKSEQRRRVGTVHILHSAAPACPRLKVVRHLCHFGPGIVWAGGQGQGNICITLELLAACPRHESLTEKSQRIDLKMTTNCLLWTSSLYMISQLNCLVLFFCDLYCFLQLN